MNKPTNKKMTVLFPEQTVISTDFFQVAQDWEIPIPGFLVIASVRKTRSISELNDAELIELVALQRSLRRGMNDVLGIKDVYFFQNEDSDHGFHIWIFPRHAWMERFGRKIQSVRPIMEYAVASMSTEQVFAEVHDAVAKMRGYFSTNRVRNDLKLRVSRSAKRATTSDVVAHQLPLL